MHRGSLCCGCCFENGGIEMVTRQELCKKIEEVFPDAGLCGVDFDVNFDEKNKAWAVDLHHGTHHLKTYIEIDEADNCLEGKSCLPLGLQVGQLKHNFDLSSCGES
jgi:hypothetical protein